MNSKLPMRLGIVAALFSMPLLVGCADRDANEQHDEDAPTDAVAATSQAITNAERDDRDPAVVALIGNDGKIYCTGVLITRSVVATAAHCVDTAPPDRVYFGRSLEEMKKKGMSIRVKSSRVHPDFDEATLMNDVAVIGLETQAAFPPMPVLSSMIDASFDKLTIRIVGFGAPESGAIDEGNLEKRSGTAIITRIESDTFRLMGKPSQTCSGDSGGPAFAIIDGREAIIGITSSGDAKCMTYGRQMRIDTFREFFEDFAEDYAAPKHEAPVANQGCSSTTPATRTTPWSPLLILAAAALVLRWRRPRALR